MAHKKTYKLVERETDRQT